MDIARLNSYERDLNLLPANFWTPKKSRCP
jgi:hypothetical protein